MWVYALWHAADGSQRALRPTGVAHPEEVSGGAPAVSAAGALDLGIAETVYVRRVSHAPEARCLAYPVRPEPESRIIA